MYNFVALSLRIADLIGPLVTEALSCVFWVEVD